MEGDSAVQAIFGPELDKLKAAGEPVPKELEAKIAKTRSDYERWLDAKYAAARGHCDAVIDPAETRQVLEFAFEAACANERPEHLPLNLMQFGDAWEQSPAPDGSLAR
jgi:3-methylcrotonyl-CoA carboxylase beta subunit